MNAKMNKPLSIALASVALGLATSGVDAAHRCDAPSGLAEAEACAKAKEGADALRQYIQRTRALYGFYYWDFAPRSGATPKAAEQAKLAKPAPQAQGEVAQVDAPK